MTRYAKPDVWVDFEDVEFKRRSEKAILAKFPDGPGKWIERWVPISQTPDGFDPEIGTTGTLTVTEWISNQWEEEGPPEPEADVTVADCVVMRETAKALLVRVPGAREDLWFPKTQIRDASECQNDGDRGKLVISEWIASQKGLGDNAQVSYESVAHDVGRARERSAPARGTRREVPVEDVAGFDPGPGDDDIPF